MTNEKALKESSVGKLMVTLCLPVIMIMLEWLFGQRLPEQQYCNAADVHGGLRGLVYHL